MKRGTFADRSEAERTTLREAFERYEREVTVHKKSATQEKGRIKTLKDSALGSMPLASIRGSDVASYRDKRATTVSASSILNELAALSHLFTIARKEWGMEHLENPVLLARKPKRPAGRDRRLMDGEEQRLLDACEKSQSVALAQLVMQLLFFLVTAYLDSAFPLSASADPNLSAIFPLVAISAICIVAMLQVPTVASALSGGVALSSMGAVGWAIGKTASSMSGMRPTNLRRSLHKASADARIVRGAAKATAGAPLGVYRRITGGRANRMTKG